MSGRGCIYYLEHVFLSLKEGLVGHRLNGEGGPALLDDVDVVAVVILGRHHRGRGFKEHLVGTMLLY